MILSPGIPMGGRAVRLSSSIVMRPLVEVICGQAGVVSPNPPKIPSGPS
jgi:hypothetical protein